MQQQYSTVNYGGANSGQGASLKVKLSQLEVTSLSIISTMHKGNC